MQGWAGDSHRIVGRSERRVVTAVSMVGESGLAGAVEAGAAVSTDRGAAAVSTDRGAAALVFVGSSPLRWVRLRW
jgi:hypothetical protein